MTLQEAVIRRKRIIRFWGSLHKAYWTSTDNYGGAPAIQDRGWAWPSCSQCGRSAEGSSEVSMWYGRPLATCHECMAQMADPDQTVGAGESF